MIARTRSRPSTHLRDDRNLAQRAGKAVAKRTLAGARRRSGHRRPEMARREGQVRDQEAALPYMAPVPVVKRRQAGQGESNQAMATPFRQGEHRRGAASDGAHPHAPWCHAETRSPRRTNSGWRSTAEAQDLEDRRQTGGSSPRQKPEGNDCRRKVVANTTEQGEGTEIARPPCEHSHRQQHIAQRPPDVDQPSTWRHRPDVGRVRRGR